MVHELMDGAKSEALVLRESVALITGLLLRSPGSDLTKNMATHAWSMPPAAAQADRRDAAAMKGKEINR